MTGDRQTVCVFHHVTRLHVTVSSLHRRQHCGDFHLHQPAIAWRLSREHANDGGIALVLFQNGLGKDREFIVIESGDAILDAALFRADMRDSFPQARLGDRRELIRHSLAPLTCDGDISLRWIQPADIACHRHHLHAVQNAVGDVVADDHSRPDVPANLRANGLSVPGADKHLRG